MERYSYTINRKDTKKYAPIGTYLEEDLKKMSTFHLKEICREEKLVNGSVQHLGKEELIHEILKFREKSTTKFLTSLGEESKERVESFLSQVHLNENTQAFISFPKPIIVYSEIGMDVRDGNLPNVSGINEEGSILLQTTSGRICGLFQLRRTVDGRWYLAKEKENISEKEMNEPLEMLYFGRNESEVLNQVSEDTLRIYPASIGMVRVKFREIQVEELEESNSPLIIELGATNTTVGSFDPSGEVQLVGSPMIPSVIGFREDGQSIEDLIYGEDALRLLEKNCEDRKISVFFNIRRWLDHPEVMERVTGGFGQDIIIKREEMLQGFLQYVIDQAMQQLKNRFSTISILTPYKHQQRYAKLFQKILSGYNVKVELNEGFAVMFQSIEKVIKQKKYQINNWYPMLLLDCGGDTTKLQSAQFCIKDLGYTYEIHMKNAYENETTEFSGNSLTIRILQLLKVKLFYALNNQEYHLPDDRLGECYRNVDKNGIKAVYAQLEREYERAESMLPTQYASYESRFPSEYNRVKNNFFYLFRLSEAIKEKFFSGNHLFSIECTTDKAKITTGQLFLDRFSISLLSQGEFHTLPNSISFTLSLYEVEAVLKPEIYQCMKLLIERKYRNREIFSYAFLRLTGQSCSMGLFLEALKEFMPGKMIQAPSKKKTEEYKLSAIKGAAAYYAGRNSGYYDVSSEFMPSSVPYTVTACLHSGEEKVLIQSFSKTQKQGVISRYMEGNKIVFLLKDCKEQVLAQIPYSYEEQELQAVTYEEIRKDPDNHIDQNETDTIRNGECKFFVWASIEDWGFYCLPVLRKQEQLYQGKRVFFDFDDETWETNYFDGRR